VADAIAFAAGFLVALATTFLIIPWMIPRLKARGVVGKDLNKPGAPEVAEMGGIPVVIGFFAGASVMVALNGFTDEALLNASLTAILGAAFVGIMDDLFDLRQRHKAILPFVLALPLAVTLDPEIYIPFVGLKDFGILMIPIAALAVTCAANAANMLEGFNGLGTGLGIIMTSTLVLLSLIHNRLDAMYVLMPMLASLVAFLWFNKYPAKIFPGDTMMLFMGATLAAAGLLSDLQLQTIFIFIPMIIEFGLKTRGHFEAENYASKSSNGYLEYHGRIESLTHVLMKRFKLTEKTLVELIWTLEATMCAVVVFVDLLV
jgi:UDP-N-acetylglucosamine--dolichyl-phosphate N-acetylglucosaminephosphotransferase